MLHLVGALGGGCCAVVGAGVGRCLCDEDDAVVAARVSDAEEVTHWFVGGDAA